MSPDWIIAALAFVTIGGMIVAGVLHFGIYLKDPKNLEAAKRVAADRESAATRVSTAGVNGRSLRQRLDDAPGINERLSNRPEGLAIQDVLFGVEWSDVRAALKG